MRKVSFLKKIRLISKSGFLASNLLNIGAMDNVFKWKVNCKNWEKSNNKLIENKTYFRNLNNKISNKFTRFGFTEEKNNYVNKKRKRNNGFDIDKELNIQEKLNQNIKFKKKSIAYPNLKYLNLEYKSELEELEKETELYNEFYRNFNHKESVTTNKFIELKYEDNFDDFKNKKENNDKIFKKRKRRKEDFIHYYNKKIRNLNNLFSLKNIELKEFDEEKYSKKYVENAINYIIEKKKEKEEIITEIKKHNEDDNFKKYLKTTLEKFKDIKEINYEDVEFKDIEKVQNETINPVNEEDRIYIQSDIEGKYEVLLSVLKIANIINIKNKKYVYYNFITGKFEDKNPGDNISIKLNIFEVNKNFKGTYINIGDIVDRCAGNYNCLKTLLLILYIKQELGDKIKLICGNHEIGWYCNDNNQKCNCCKDIKELTTLICYKAISLGQIKFFDNIEIKSKKYVLSHKIIYHNNDGTKEFHEILKYINKEKYKHLKDFSTYIDKDHCLTEEGFKILDKFNDKFKENFTNFISEINTYTYDTDLLRYFIFNYNKKLNYENMVDYGHRYDEDELEDKVKYIIKNSINGHDHHDYDACYNEKINLLIADNWSCIEKDLNNYRSNIHFIDKTKDIINSKIIEITKDDTRVHF